LEGGGFVCDSLSGGGILDKVELQVYPEPMVARVTGVARVAIKRARAASLEKGPDWSLVDSVVTYGPDGLKKLLSALGLRADDLAWPVPPGPPRGGFEAGPLAAATREGSGDAVHGASPATVVAEAVAEAAAVETARALVELVVLKNVFNPGLLIARHGATEVRVRVRSNVNFRPGMVLRARAPIQAGGLWHMEGNCPRRPGHY